MVRKNSIRRSKRPAARSRHVDLDLPDWSGMDDSSKRVTVEAAFELCEQYASWFPLSPAQSHLRRRGKCLVEFTF
jgi:hypothetical protein